MSDWLEVTVHVPAHRQEAASDLMDDLGAMAVTSTDAGDQPVLEPGVGETPFWPELRVTGLFPGDADGFLIQALLARELGEAADRAELKHLADQDWSRTWMDRFGPMRFGQQLWICPSNQPVPEGAGVVVKLDPGLAFGTGTHPTTALCLEALDRDPPVGAIAVDYGCGSGVLAIASLKLGARQVACVDIDPQALTATRDNAAVNGVAEGIEIDDGAELTPGRFDLVLANILAGPLMALAERLCVATRPGGRLILSGLLADQATMVENAYRPFCDAFDTHERDGWICIEARRLS